MGIPGRKPKPVELKIFEGNPGHHPIPNIMKSVPVKPTCPEWLSEYAREEWNRKIDEVSRLGILTKLNISLFEALCAAYGEMKQAIIQHDRIASTQWIQQYRLLCGEFGMSPASIAKMPIPKDTGKDEDFGGLLDD
jgi:phage terminase small subunit